MSIRGWIFDFLGGKDDAECISFSQTMQELNINKLYFHTCINMVSNIISKCEFKTLKNGDEIKEKEYYLWNIEPNPNQNSTQFVNKLIAALFTGNEALVFEKHKSIYVADSFTREKGGLKDDKFDQISIDGEEVKGITNNKDILYFELHNEKIKTCVDSMYDLYKNLITHGIAQYKSETGNKGFLEKDATDQGDEEQKKKREEAMKKAFEQFWQDENAVMELPRGYKYNPLSKSKSNTGTQQTTRDIRAMINDVAAFWGTAFGIPPKLLTGETENTEHAMDEFLTLCINTLVVKLSTEINRKRYGYNQFKNNSKLVIDTKATKHVDLLSVAASVDKLISSGAFTINEVREITNEQPIESDVGDKHFMTKNYSTADLIATGQNSYSGGGGDG